MSLPEMLVAMFILTGALMALLGGLITGVRSSATSETRGQVNALAAAWVEQLQALPWASVGYRPADPAFAAATCSSGPCSGEPTVKAADGDGNAPTAADQVIAAPNGVTVTRRTWITWRADAAIGVPAPDPQGASYTLKHLTVQMTWTQGNQTRVVMYEGLRTPTPTEVTPKNLSATSSPTPAPTATPVASTSPTPSPTASATSTASPTPAATTAAASALTVTAAASPDQNLSTAYQLSLAIQVTARTSVRATSVTADYADAGAARTVALTGDAAGTTWTATLPAYGAQFAAGNLTFAMKATAAGVPVATATSNAVRLAAPAAVRLITPETSPLLCVDKSTDKTLQASTISIEIVNASTSDVPTLTLSGSSLNGVQLTASGQTGTNGGPIFTYVVAQGVVVNAMTNASNATVTASFSIRRPGDSSATTASFPLNVTQTSNGRC